MSAITDRIEDLIEQKGIKRADVSRGTGIPEATLRNWIRGTSPQAEPLYKVASYLGVSVEYLITGKEDAPAQTPTQIPQESELERKYNSLNETGKIAVDSILNNPTMQETEERKIG